MLQRKLAVLIFFINAYLTHPVLSLLAEDILGGGDALVENFLHQVEVVGRKNFTNQYISICGGGIIAHNLILAAAQCFVEIIDYIKVISFSIIVGTCVFNSPTYVIDIELIYLPWYVVGLYYNDLAVAKLKGSFELYPNERWKILDIPYNNDIFNGYLGRIAGCGVNKDIEYTPNKFTGVKEVSKGSRDFLLKVGIVKIVDNPICKKSHDTFNKTMQFCATMIPNASAVTSGICKGDAGSPLVFNNTVVGIASKINSDCNDTVVGSIYTRVYYYREFITAIKEGNPKKHTLIYYNRPHRFR